MSAGVLYSNKKNCGGNFPLKFHQSVAVSLFSLCPHPLTIHRSLVSSEVQLALSIWIQCKLISLSLFVCVCVCACIASASNLL